MLDKALSTYVWAIYTMPRIVLMPLLLLWVGINDAARIWIIVLSAVPATLVVIMEGVKTVDNGLLTAGRSFGAGRLQLFTKIVMPSTVPFIAIGVRMGVSRGLLGLFIGEVFTGVNGIGYIMTLAQKNFNSARMYAMLLIFVLFCVAPREPDPVDREEGDGRTPAGRLSSAGSRRTARRSPRPDAPRASTQDGDPAAV